MNPITFAIVVIIFAGSVPQLAQAEGASADACSYLWDVKNKAKEECQKLDPKKQQDKTLIDEAEKYAPKRKDKVMGLKSAVEQAKTVQSGTQEEVAAIERLKAAMAELAPNERTLPAWLGDEQAAKLKPVVERLKDAKFLDAQLETAKKRARSAPTAEQQAQAQQRQKAFSGQVTGLQGRLGGAESARNVEHAMDGSIARVNASAMKEISGGAAALIGDLGSEPADRGGKYSQYQSSLKTGEVMAPAADGATAPGEKKSPAEESKDRAKTAGKVAGILTLAGAAAAAVKRKTGEGLDTLKDLREMGDNEKKYERHQLDQKSAEAAKWLKDNPPAASPVAETAATPPPAAATPPVDKTTQILNKDYPGLTDGMKKLIDQYNDYALKSEYTLEQFIESKSGYIKNKDIEGLKGIIHGGGS